MEFKQFSESHARQLTSWFPTQDQFLLWGGFVFTWPLTADELIIRSKLSGLEFCVLTDGNMLLGFIELKRVSDREMRLCRVVVTPHIRGKGLGKALVSHAVEYIKQSTHCTAVTLAVFTANKLAFNCYHSLGFKTIDIGPKSHEVNGQQWPLLQMSLDL
ncbi:GNAT family N-acetyltransferase [uncultured Vibrio sp.]|uniref:GNAT family N-acetyltransferase n=1 Tax=uncultured Vibrio sp. TaxID=114054 RepID=UPI0025F41309|nr:GNAT family N-acetyltransferase [uncultured Vibrio sp.]